MSVEGYMRSDIQKLVEAHPGCKFYLTGFGIGGAMATIAALDIKAIFGSVHQLYTYGQPRVGN